MTDEEEALYRQLEAMSGAPVELAAGEAGGDRELTDAELEAVIEAMVADDQVEALYQQFSNLGR